MRNINNGYVGARRSIRSLEAIGEFKVPLSQVNKTMIGDFLNAWGSMFSKADLEFLKSVSVAKWKYMIREKGVGYDSWHHTSSWFNETIHYDLSVVADRLIAEKDTLDKEYKEYRSFRKKESQSFKYGVIKVKVWGGSRRNPKLKGYKTVPGIIVGKFLYYKNKSKLTGAVKKLKTVANRVVWVEEYGSYEELIEKHNRYQNTKELFDRLIAEKFKQ